jgi:iron complex transport system substrate-binding protein
MRYAHGFPAPVPALVALLAGCAAACAGEPPARATAGADPPAAAAPLRDDAGTVLDLAAPPRRVVSLVPAVTDLILELDAADRLVARTDYDVDPRLAALPSLGGGLDPSLEALAALRPELLIAWVDERSRSLARGLALLGIPTFAVRIETVADADRAVRALGRILDLDARADAHLAERHRALHAVRAAVAGRPRATVFYAIALDPPMAAGPGTFIDELLEIAGGANIFGDGPAWAGVSFEEAVRRDPDVVILALGEVHPDQLQHVRRLPGWREIGAVRRGRVALVDAGEFNRPGPGLAATARAIAGILHPDAFAAPPPPAAPPLAAPPEPR